MSAGSKIGITAVLLLFLGGLAAADALSSEETNLASLLPDFGTSSADSSDATASAGTVVPKNSGPLLADVTSELGMSMQESKEESLLAPMVMGKAQAYSQVILKDDDRIGTVTWTESPQVKTWFIGLKEALLKEFTDKLTGLKDETLQEEGKPVRNVLSFSDPGISQEQIVLVRVRERLYEFHIAPGKDADMLALFQALTER